MKVKKERGVTLIALIVTIVVLLVLAGITIVNITGENGIINQSKTSKDKTDSSRNQEIIGVEVARCWKYDDELKASKLKEGLEGLGATVDGSTFPMSVTFNGENYTIDANGNVTLITEE